MNKRIMQARKKLDYTQDEFAESLGLTKNFISLIETGNREPSDRTVRDMCRIHNINDTWLRTGKGEMFVPVTRENEIAKLTMKCLDDEPDSFRNKFVSALARLSEDEWGLLEKIAKELVGE